MSNSLTSQTPPANPTQVEQPNTQTPSTPPAPGATQEPKTEAAPKGEDAPKVEGTEPKVEEKAAAPEPLTVEALKVPEGFEVDQEKMASFVELMNDTEISGAERAQKVLDLQTDLMKQVSERGNELWLQTQETWQKEVLELPEFKGDKWTAASAQISKLLDAHGTPELREAFDYTGAGNHPEVVKFLYKVASAFGEGLPTQGNPTGNGSTTAAQRLFPSMK